MKNNFILARIRRDMRCACNRWGPGTTCEKPTNTAASKELQERLNKMKEERGKQDTMWLDTTSTITTSTIKTINYQPSLSIKYTSGQ
jgi:hypothetical protein